jgi:hypothetical protein
MAISQNCSSPVCMSHSVPTRVLFVVMIDTLPLGKVSAVIVESFLNGHGETSLPAT